MIAPSVDDRFDSAVPFSDAEVYELKFLVSGETAARIEDSARGWMTAALDAGMGWEKTYQTTYHVASIYCDTADMSLLHRTAQKKSSKLRVRRYGESDRVILESKTRRKQRVIRQRTTAAIGDIRYLNEPADDANWNGSWFQSVVRDSALLPVCRIGYTRRAYFRSSSQGPIRLTIDRDILGRRIDEWSFLGDKGTAFLSGMAIGSFSFHRSLPGPFKSIIQTLQLQARRVSKYRLFLEPNVGTSDRGILDA